MNVTLSSTQLLLGVGGLLAALWIWRAAARRARAAADAARSGARLISLAGRVMFMAGVIAGVQWIVLTHPGANTWFKVSALVVPALFAAHTLTRALTVTTVDASRRRGGQR